jgi:hypothetical protein
VREPPRGEIDPADLGEIGAGQQQLPKLVRENGGAVYVLRWNGHRSPRSDGPRRKLGTNWDTKIVLGLDDGQKVPLYMNFHSDPEVVAIGFLLEHELPDVYLDTIVGAISRAPVA